jgi:3-phenylpropionate/trans-cinnamate dioxygenase ferredoxin reductase subunit
MSDATENKPDFATGVAEHDLPDGGMLVGQVGEEAVLLARRGAEVFAIGAACTHYGGPLGEGLMVGDKVRCPWHHACFSLRTGEALAAPALNATSCWRVERRDGRIIVHEKLSDAGWRKSAKPRPPSNRLGPVVIVGGGAAGNAAAETLRREGFSGPVTLLSADSSRPYDRPNLSKDYLAGSAQAEWIPLRSPEFYAENDIDLKIGARVTAVDTAAHTVSLADGGRISWGGLLLATGAEPVKLKGQGATLPHVHVLRSLADSNALIAGAENARRCVVVGASFIGLEVAASLRARGLEVHVVAPEARPMERVMGAAIGDAVRAIHESHGVIFNLGATVSAIESDSVTLSTGARLDADLVVVGIGVRPELTLATQAGLAIAHGVMVDPYLQTSTPGIYAAGDIARWPD